MADIDPKLVQAEHERLRATPEYQDAIAAELARYAQNSYIDRKALRAVCQHPPETRYYWNDPSGNNGGGWCCGVCEADL